jgi:hypothetical protein
MSDPIRFDVPILPIAQPRSALAQVEVPARGPAAQRPHVARRAAR